MIRKFGLSQRLGMACHALGGETPELTNSGSFVASITSKRRVCPDERKAILMVLEGSQRGLPSPHSMALFALDPQLALMDIRMTIGTIGPDVGEHQIDVALRAGNALVEPTQRVGRFIVVELRNVPKRFPSRERMAIVTSQLQGPMGTSCHIPLATRFGPYRADRRHEEKQKCPHSHNPRHQSPLTTLERDR